MGETFDATARDHADECPRCGSPDIEGDEMVIESGWASQGCHCNVCGHRWHDVYALVERIPDEDE